MHPLKLHIDDRKIRHKLPNTRHIAATQSFPMFLRFDQIKKKIVPNASRLKQERAGGTWKWNSRFFCFHVRFCCFFFIIFWSSPNRRLRWMSYRRKSHELGRAGWFHETSSVNERPTRLFLLLLLLLVVDGYHPSAPLI